MLGGMLEPGSPAYYAAVIVAFAAGWGVVSLAALLWLTPRGLELVPDDKRWQWARTVVSTAHAVATAVLALYYLCRGDVELWDNFAAPHAEWEHVVCLSLGYFLFDLLLILVARPVTSDLYESIIHHVINIYVHFVPVCVYHGYVSLSIMGCASLPTRIPRSPVAALNGAAVQHRYRGAVDADREHPLVHAQGRAGGSWQKSLG